jgi:hypothetical protein
MRITDVAWSSDIRGRPVLELKLDGHPAYIHSSQRTELTRRGLLDGMVFLKSERSSQVPSDYIAGNYAPDYVGLDLVGCTDDPEVFALDQEMCTAISADTWHEGPRPIPA